MFVASIERMINLVDEAYIFRLSCIVCDTPEHFTTFKYIMQQYRVFYMYADSYLHNNIRCYCYTTQKK